MSSQNVAIALLLLVAVAAAAPSKGGLNAVSPVKTIATAVENHGNSAVQEASCAGQPTELQCILCNCVWVNNRCIGSNPVC
uniref:Uncharacterized protein n=1 Tax=Plectus sambesii TaxID=2011161 RepID=A0A914VUQ9_9BILA